MSVDIMHCWEFYLVDFMQNHAFLFVELISNSSINLGRWQSKQQGKKSLHQQAT
jgi:hypothetical protein